MWDVTLLKLCISSVDWNKILFLISHVFSCKHWSSFLLTTLTWKNVYYIKKHIIFDILVTICPTSLSIQAKWAICRLVVYWISLGKNRIEYKEDMHISNVCTSTVYDTLCSPYKQPCTFNKVQYPADRNVFKVPWFCEMSTQVPEFFCGQSFTVTLNMWGCFSYLLASITFGTVYQRKFR